MPVIVLVCMQSNLLHDYKYIIATAQFYACFNIALNNFNG